jgi:hypothetical protein
LEMAMNTPACWAPDKQSKSLSKEGQGGTDKTPRNPCLAARFGAGRQKGVRNVCAKHPSGRSGKRSRPLLGVKQLCVRTCVARNIRLEDHTDLTADNLAQRAKTNDVAAQRDLLEVYGLFAVKSLSPSIPQSREPMCTIRDILSAIAALAPAQRGTLLGGPTDGKNN